MVVIRAVLLDIHLKYKALTPIKTVISQMAKLDIHLKYKALTPGVIIMLIHMTLDIHLKYKVLTPYKLEQNESQLFITKISEFFECLNIKSAYAIPIFIFKPQTKAFQHAQPKMGNEIHIYFISKNLFSHYKYSLFFLFINKISAK